MMNTVRKKFPLKSLLEGEEDVSWGCECGPKILKRIFGTTNYDEIEENLTIDGVADEKGDYQLVFEVEAKVEKRFLFQLLHQDKEV